MDKLWTECEFIQYLFTGNSSITCVQCCAARRIGRRLKRHLRLAGLRPSQSPEMLASPVGAEAGSGRNPSGNWQRAPHPCLAGPSGEAGPGNGAAAKVRLGPCVSAAAAQVLRRGCKRHDGGVPSRTATAPRLRPLFGRAGSEENGRGRHDGVGAAGRTIRSDRSLPAASGVLWGARPAVGMVGLPVRFECQELGQLPEASGGAGFPLHS